MFELIEAPTTSATPTHPPSALDSVIVETEMTVGDQLHRVRESVVFVDQEVGATLMDFSNPQQPLATLTVSAGGVALKAVARMR